MALEPLSSLILVVYICLDLFTESRAAL